MTTEQTNGASSPSASSAGLCVGGRVRLLKSIYDDGEDHHPPGWIAQAGEVLIVKEVRGEVLAVAHEGNPGAFTIYPGEYEAHNVEAQGRGAASCADSPGATGSAAGDSEKG